MTTIDEQYLKTEFDFNIKERLRAESVNVGVSVKSLFNQIYDSLYLLATRDDASVASLADMEARLDTQEKKEWFKKALAYQLIYIWNTGKNSLIHPENNDLNARAWDYCTDSVRIMRRVLGFNRPSLFTVR